MKSKLLPILLLLLILLNGVLIFMLVTKPHENQRNHQKNNFLTTQLNFTESQTEKFKELDKTHRGFMRSLEEETRSQKDILFNSFNKSAINVDSLTSKIGLLSAKKDAEVYRFFKSVRTLCTVEQTNMFDKIIKRALRAGDRVPPRDGRNPPQRREGMPPPPR